MVSSLQLIAITGDFITHNAKLVAELTAPLAELKARAGVFASLGNHDVWNAPRRITEALGHHGIRVLTNSGVALTKITPSSGSLASTPPGLAISTFPLL